MTCGILLPWMVDQTSASCGGSRLVTTGLPGKSRISGFLKKKQSRILYECSFNKLSSSFGNNLVLKLRGRYIIFILLLILYLTYVTGNSFECVARVIVYIKFRILKFFLIQKSKEKYPLF